MTPVNCIEALGALSEQTVAAYPLAVDIASSPMCRMRILEA